MAIEIKASRPYRVQIGQGEIDRCGDQIKSAFLEQKTESGKPGTIPGKLAIFTDSNVNELYGDKVQTNLKRSGFEVFRFVFLAGEASKNLECITAFYDFLAEHRFTRTDAIVALGGGVSGDMAGFAAATYLRGIPFVQMPTTLLAAIDSSVGGKTGINIKEGKNLVGAFWQPVTVLCDTNVLSTLRKDTFADGMAEAVKTGAIWDKTLFQMIQTTDFDTFERVHGELEDIIARCVKIKGYVVEQDEREAGLRRILNFGHTLGHAIEAYYNFRLDHGKAVAIGMVEITKLSERKGFTEPGTADLLQKVLTEKGLPTSCDAPLKALWEIARGDKKAEGDWMNLVLLKEIGTCFVHQISMDELEQWV